MSYNVIYIHIGACLWPGKGSPGASRCLPLASPHSPRSRCGWSLSYPCPLRTSHLHLMSYLKSYFIHFIALIWPFKELFQVFHSLNSLESSLKALILLGALQEVRGLSLLEEVARLAPFRREPLVHQVRVDVAVPLRVQHPEGSQQGLGVVRVVRVVTETPESEYGLIRFS